MQAEGTVRNLLPTAAVEKLPEQHHRMAAAFLAMTEDPSYPLGRSVSSTIANNNGGVGDPASHKGNHWDQFTPEFVRALLKPEYWPDFRNNGMNGGMESKKTLHTAAKGKGSIFRNYAERENYELGHVYSAPTDQERQISDPKLVASLKAQYQWLSTRVGEARLQKFMNIGIGRPLSHWDGSNHLNDVDLRHAFYTCQIIDLLQLVGTQPQVIGEIGGGFGGLAGNLKQCFPGATLLLFDLPESLMLQMYYLGQRFPNARILDATDILNDPARFDDLSGIDFVFLPGWEITRLPPNSVDLWVNTESFAEMLTSVSQGYVQRLNETTRPRGVAYIYNRYAKASSGTLYRFKDMALDDCWLVALSQPGRTNAAHQLGLMRTERTAAIPPRQHLAALPPIDSRDIRHDFLRIIGSIGLILAGDGIGAGNLGIPGLLRWYVKRLRIKVALLRNRLRLVFNARGAARE